MSTSIVKHHPYSLKFPAAKKTNDDDLDEERQARRQCAISVIDYMLEDDSICLPLYQFVLKRKARALSYADEVDKDCQFKSITTFGRIEMKWVVNMVVELSGLTISDVIAATKHDEQTPRHLLQFALCYQSGLTIGQSGKVKQVLRAMFMKRSVDLGSRLAEFRRGGGLNSDKSINWKKGVYTMTFASDSKSAKITKITHTSGDSIDISETAVTREWNLLNNWSDYDAMVKLKPLKPTLVSQFFATAKTGPYKYKKVSGDNKVFQSEPEDVKQTFFDRQREQKGVSEDTVEKELQAMHAEKRAKVMAEARGKAKTVANKIRARRSLNCEKSQT